MSGTDTSSGYAWLNVYELLDNGSKRYVSSTFVDVNVKDKGASSANLYLDSDKSYGGTGIYQVEVKDVYGNASGKVKLDVEGFEVDASPSASELNTNDNSIGTATELLLSSTVDDMIAYDSDAAKSDIVDFFKVVVTEDGNYSLEFEGINGNTSDIQVIILFHFSVRKTQNQTVFTKLQRNFCLQSLNETASR